MSGDPRAPSVLIVLRVRPRRPTPLGAVSLPVWSFADRTWSQGLLRCLKATPLEVPLPSTVIASPSFSPGSLWAFFSGCLRMVLTAITRASICSFVFFCLSFFPPIPYHNRLFEAVATDYQKTDLVHMPVLIAYSRYLEPTE